MNDSWIEEYLNYIDKKSHLKKIVVFGGSSELAKNSLVNLCEYDIEYLSSKDCDVRDYTSVQNKIKNCDIVLYFSVINYDNLISNLNLEEVTHSIDVNVKGFINVLKSSAIEFKKRRSGRIIYISSILSDSSVRGSSIYSSCKSFCETMVRIFATENAKYNITCNSIQLGYFDCGLTNKIKQDILNQIKTNIPSSRFGVPEELGSLLVEVISNNYINGSNLKISGGL